MTTIEARLEAWIATKKRLANPSPARFGGTRGMAVSSMTVDQYIELNRKLREGEISTRDFLSAYTSYPSMDVMPEGSPYDPSITESRQHSFSNRGHY